MSKSIKVLLIGINYVGSSAQLNGCINDIIHIRKYLKANFDVNDSQILQMTEASDDPAKIPTAANIVSAFKWLVADNTAESRLFLHYSGHGGYVRDKSGDELDQQDETIVPLDYMTKGQISDDDIRKLLIEPLKPGAKLTCIFDCCHSGTILDLRYNYRVDMSNETKTQYNILVDSNYKHSNALITVLSGCKDSQTSADAYEEGKYQGAMTFSFLKTMEKLAAENKRPTYKDVIKNVCLFIKSRGYEQIPQLSTGNFQDLTANFSLL